MSVSKFESIGEDMMVEVFVKVGQNLKAVLRLRCVSKLWQRLVNSRCLRRLTCNDPLEFKGHLMKIECGCFGVMYRTDTPVLAYIANRCQGDNNHFGQEEEGRRLLEKIEDSGLVFLDACNGLLLHRLNNNNNPTSPPVYRVSNLETNSWIVVNGEADTAYSMYNKMDHAALAYDPAESLVSFKIVAFFRRLTPPYEYLRHKCIRIYSSKTGKWSPDLNFDHLLDPILPGPRWLQQSFYFNGGIYRVPMAEYLLRFEITDAENCDDECHVQAIQLSKATRRFNFHVGINKGQINLALPTGIFGLKVWVLQEEGHGNNYFYQWILKHDISSMEMPAGFVLPTRITAVKGLGFNPYEDSVVLYAVDDIDFRFVCCHLDRNDFSVSSNYRATRGALPRVTVSRSYSFPMFSCAVPLQRG